MFYCKLFSISKFVGLLSVWFAAGCSNLELDQPPGVDSPSPVPIAGNTKQSDNSVDPVKPHEKIDEPKVEVDPKFDLSLFTGTEPNNYGVDLRWEVKPGVKHYILYKQELPNERVELIRLDSQRVEYRDLQVKSGTNYDYRLGYVLETGSTFENNTEKSISIPLDLEIKSEVLGRDIVHPYKRIFLRSTGRILLGSDTFDLNVDEFISENGNIVAFTGPADPGSNGRSAPNLNLKSRLGRGTVFIDLRGQAGGHGNEGARGQDGGNGARGRDGRLIYSNRAKVPAGEIDDPKHYYAGFQGCGGPKNRPHSDCVSTRGQDGGPGQQGGDGGRGGNGGEGGKVYISFENRDAIVVQAQVNGGIPGTGGKPGSGGAGGAGGPGGTTFLLHGKGGTPCSQSPYGGAWCMRPDGASGAPGPAGHQGEPGAPGEPGRVCIEGVSLESDCRILRSR